jgi:hypothetical protein
MTKKAAQAIHDGKSDAEATAAIPISRQELMEFSENVVSLIRGNADPAVPDFDSQEAGPAAATNNYSAFDGITDRV